jgi:hypothetical protein
MRKWQDVQELLRQMIAGVATLAVRPESVKLDLEFPPADVGTPPDGATMALTEEPIWRARFVEDRASLEARVTDKGQVIGISSVPPVAESESFRLIGFTPEAFAQLPDGAVQLGDCWDVNNQGHPSSGGLLAVKTHYGVTECWHKTELTGVIQLEGSITRPTRGGEQCEFGPEISVSHFDPICGYFLDQVTVTSGHVRLGSDEDITFSFSTIRQVFQLAEPPVATRPQLSDPLFRR